MKYLLVLMSLLLFSFSSLGENADQWMTCERRVSYQGEGCFQINLNQGISTKFHMESNHAVSTKAYIENYKVVIIEFSGGEHDGSKCEARNLVPGKQCRLF